MDYLFALNGRVTMWLARIAAVFLAGIAVLTFGDVVARYFFNAAFTFTVEATEIAMALIVFLSVGLVTHDQSHIVVDFITLRLSPRARASLSLVINLLALLFVIVMTWRLFLQAVFILSKGDKTPIWNFPLWTIAFDIAFGSLFLITGLLLHWMRTLRSVRGEPTDEKPAAARPYSE